MASREETPLKSQNKPTLFQNWKSPFENSALKGQEKLMPNRSNRQTVQTLITQLLQELSDLGLHCLQKALEVVCMSNSLAYIPASELAKSSMECELGFPYGLSEREKLDIFGANTLPNDAPIFVYIHGGYWQDLNRELSSFMALPLTKAGAVVVVIGYELAPKASLDEIVCQVKKGVGFVLNMAKRRGSSGVYLCGSSAGGHLVAMMLAQDWLNECMVSDNLIKGAVLVSGVYDLRPLVNTYINDALKMTEEDALRNSPLNLKDTIIERSRRRKILVVVAEHDSPEFRKQSISWNTTLLAGGVQSLFMQIGDTDHFNVIDNLRLEDYTLTKEVLRLMGLYIDPIIDGMQSAGLS